MSGMFEKKIMIIEDNEFSRVLITTKLKKNGFKNLSVYGSSVEAWEEIARTVLVDNPFDLIITDLNMPDLDGMDLISKIKDDPLSVKLKIIVVSADADQFIIDFVLALGACAYLVKPFLTNEMVAVVEAVLSDRDIPEVKGMFPAM